MRQLAAAKVNWTKIGGFDAEIQIDLYLTTIIILIYIAITVNEKPILLSSIWSAEFYHHQPRCAYLFHTPYGIAQNSLLCTQYIPIEDWHISSLLNICNIFIWTFGCRFGDSHPIPNFQVRTLAQRHILYTVSRIQNTVKNFRRASNMEAGGANIE